MLARRCNACRVSSAPPISPESSDESCPSTMPCPDPISSTPPPDSITASGFVVAPGSLPESTSNLDPSQSPSSASQPPQVQLPFANPLVSGGPPPPSCSRPISSGTVKHRYSVHDSLRQCGSSRPCCLHSNLLNEVTTYHWPIPPANGQGTRAGSCMPRLRIGLRGLVLSIDVRHTPYSSTISASQNKTSKLFLLCR